MVCGLFKAFGSVSGPLYSSGKELVLYINRKFEYIERLEQNLTYLTMEITILNSRKIQADRLLKMAPLKEKTGEYHMVVEQFEIFRKDLEKFLNKYTRYTGRSLIPNVETEATSTSSSSSRSQTQNSSMTLPDLNESVAKSIIDNLKAIEPEKWSKNFRHLGNLSRDVEKLCARVNLINNSLKPESLIVDGSPDVAILQHGYFDLPQFDRLYVDKIIEHLKEDDVKRIAVVGPIGVGKSTVMKMLNNRFKDCKSLSPDYVIWISMSAKQDDVVVSIQDKILSQLKLNQSLNTDTECKKHIISCFLSEKKYILLIDQVSTEIDLDSVGIHNDHKFGKVVVAPRNKVAIRNMNIIRKVEVQKLSAPEAMEFFEACCEINERNRETAENITKCCDGLPLVINLVASFLKDANESVWHHVKRTLEFNPKPTFDKTLTRVGEAHEMVYDELGEDWKMECSYYEAVFPFEHRVHKDYLVECWMAEGFLDIEGPTEDTKLRDARDCGETVLKELTDRYLLERCLYKENEYVKVPFYFRKVLWRKKDHLTTWKTCKAPLNKHDRIWKMTKRISLIDCGLEIPIPTDPNCSDLDLEALFLQHNQGLSEIGASFFTCMGKLRILDLQQTGISTLSSSICFLGSLVNLYLNGCSRLEDLPLNADSHTKLELLDIRGTSIKPWLPPVIESLQSLRCLRVSFDEERCSKGNQIRANGIIRKLEKLEELIIETDLSESWKSAADQIADAIAQLEHLSTLHFHFPTQHSLEKFKSTSRSWKNFRGSIRTEEKAGGADSIILSVPSN